MGCDQSIPVDDEGRRPPPRRPHAAHARPQAHARPTDDAAKQQKVKGRVEAKKKTAEYQNKRAQLLQQKAAETQAKKEQAIAKAKKEKGIPPPPPQTALKKDIQDYKKKSATYGGNTDAPEDPEQFRKQAEELIPAEVRMISGCEDQQTSADVMNAGEGLPDPKGRAGGACTSALLELLYKYKDEKFSFQDALMALREKLQQQGHEQIPQLTSSRPLDLNETSFSFHASSKGTRRALLVGINYVGQQGQLRGCHNDVYHMKDYLKNIHGFPESEIVVLTDDGGGEQPMKQKVLAELKRLVDVSQDGDSCFFHYSGHGGFLEADQNSLKQKNDQYDQTLIPLDHRRAGQIRDINLFNHFVRPMRAGVVVTCLMDCCHSGSVLDLPYSFKPTSEGRGEYRQETNVADMAGIAFLAILAGVVLDSLLFDPVQSSLSYSLGSDIAMYEGMYADALYEDLIERELEYEVEREIEEEIEREVEKEIENEVEKEIERELEEEIERQVEQELERELERELQREIEREVEREIEREVEREIEREIENEMMNAMLGGGGGGGWDY